jgi:hypothetical protein
MAVVSPACHRHEHARRLRCDDIGPARAFYGDTRGVRLGAVSLERDERPARRESMPNARPDTDWFTLHPGNVLSAISDVEM